MDTTSTQTEFGQRALPIPDTCPICHRSVVPKAIGAQTTVEVRWHDQLRLEFVWQCPAADCHHLFIGRYAVYFSRDTAVLYTVVPAVPRPPSVNERLAGVSSEFAATYKEAALAEQASFSRICGVGYRKSLEFLIKDYIISTRPGQREVVIRSPLGKCISDYIDDPRIRQMAERAVWLGNDETHYFRKWEDKDINELKKLISLTTHYIQMDLEAREALESMPEGR